jgi:hypothetical protein
MTTAEARLGLRCRFTGKDRVFHNGEREGKLGTIVTDARLEEADQWICDCNSCRLARDAHPFFFADWDIYQKRSANFGGGTCGWQVDGEEGVYVTALGDLTEEAK